MPTGARVAGSPIAALSVVVAVITTLLLVTTPMFDLTQIPLT